MVEAPDPTVVRVVVVHADDVVAAHEARERGDRDAALRLTPPFSGRIRARLHAGPAGEADPETAAVPVRIPPGDLVDASAPPYPDPADTEDALRADPDATYTVERHRERHAAAVAEWREAVAAALVDAVTLDVAAVPTTTADDHRVEVAVLGR